MREVRSMGRAGRERAAGDDEGTLHFDEWGELVGSAPTAGRVAEAGNPCDISILDGSWLLQLVSPPPGPTSVRVLSDVRGPMRIEVGASVLRVSGDIYVRRSRSLQTGVADSSPRHHPGITAEASGDATHRDDARASELMAFEAAPLQPWYPQLPMNEYSWYFRSTGATYAAGTLTFRLERRLWDRVSGEFVSIDTGTMALTCQRGLVPVTDEPVVMSGSAQIGGQSYSVTATKTSNLYRACRVEVDVMTTRVWPATATLCSGALTTFRQVYGRAGWDVHVGVDELAVPEDASLSIAELQTLIATHRGSGGADDWRLWLLVGSSQGGLFGIMFDQDAVPREGAVGFADATLPNSSIIEVSARGRPLDEVPSAFLRTLVHEAGHALNLFHPKHDVHSPPIGTEIMNQTGDVMSFASATNPYPCNATFAFAEHDRLSLVHSPDPQVRPGWKGFGWGHGSLSSGVPVPTDAEGLSTLESTDGLRLELRLPTDVFVGEYVIAEVILTNVSDEPREVTTRLNLAEGDLRLLHTAPGSGVEQVHDVVVACGPRTTVELPPNSSITGRMQVFYTNEGITFDEPGPHAVRAELDVGDLTAVRSQRVVVHVRTAAAEDERDIAVTALGMAIALGDFGGDEAARERLTRLADQYPEQDTGAAAALVLVNSLLRGHADHRSASVRDAEPGSAREYLDRLLSGRSAQRVLELAATVASPAEKDAPVVQAALARVREGGDQSIDLEQAVAVAEDFVTPSPR
jgi:hypothetical protein